MPLTEMTIQAGLTTFYLPEHLIVTDICAVRAFFRLLWPERILTQIAHITEDLLQ